MLMYKKSVVHYLWQRRKLSTFFVAVYGLVVFFFFFTNYNIIIDTVILAVFPFC